MADTCAHAECFCETGDGEFCGEHCEQAARRGRPGATCECGHIACEEATMREGGVHPTGG